ncbi:alginate export family protein [Gluconobacter sp. Dm-44]|uniref:alginate export family protein n=1 Tax=Gluconobacter sp. Dm-44 TaxID=2799805 RepID=UPI001B8BACA3|nr:alginate export family protein [Gluconobacter sp. Dm-44]MBS1060418.1 alginate export family protein [Gluconobacter sp. Dm-44]
MAGLSIFTPHPYTPVLAGLALGAMAFSSSLKADDSPHPSTEIHPSATSKVRAVSQTVHSQQGRPLHSPDWGIFNAGNGAASGFGSMAGFGQVRWAEDWSDIVNMPPAQRRNDWFNRLKYIRLNESGSIWLSLNAEERFRYIYENQPLMGTAGKTNANRILLRNLYGADLHLGEHVRAYAEFLYGVAGGSHTYGYQTGVQRERLDLQQGILEVKGNILGAKAGVIGGRQVFLDTPVFMQSARDLTNAQQTWDGFRGYAIWKRFRVDLFDFMQTNKLPDAVFGDGTNYSARMYGAMTSTALPAFTAMGKKSQLFVDIFYIGYLYSGTTASIPTTTGTEAGSSRRDNVGMRLWGNVGPFSTSLSGVFQGGQFRPAQESQPTRAVRAYAVNASLLYNRPDLPTKPSAGLQADLFSGGSYKSKDGAIGTFASPYFPLPYYNDVTLSVTSQNLIGVGPLATFALQKNLHFKLHVPFFWRESTQDAVYGTGKIYSWRNGLSGGFIGVTPQTQLAWNFAPHWTWTHDIAGFITSRSMRAAGAKSDAFYMQTLEFKF